MQSPGELQAQTVPAASLLVIPGRRELAGRSADLDASHGAQPVERTSTESALGLKHGRMRRHFRSSGMIPRAAF